jgi:hypothetical protein
LKTPATPIASLACAFYFDHEPALDRYLLNTRAEERLEQQGISASPLQKYLTMSGTVAVITAALIGATVGLAGAVTTGHSPWAAFVPGVAAASFALALMVRYLDRQISAESQDGYLAANTHGRHQQRTHPTVLDAMSEFLGVAADLSVVEHVAPTDFAQATNGHDRRLIHRIVQVRLSRQTLLFPLPIEVCRLCPNSSEHPLAC